MTADLADLNARIKQAVAHGQLIESSAKNIRTLLEGAGSDVYFRSVKELVHAAEWQELNDRFYQTLAFGTGGLRGRTIGKIVTTAERGNAREGERPEFPCVGTNAMNFFNINRATRGLVAYLQDWNRREGISTKPKLVIAHDPRFFSKEFAELAAKSQPKMVATRLCSMVRVLSRSFRLPFAFARERRDRNYRQPQPAARQWLQSLFRRRRAGDRSTRQRDHCQSERDHDRVVHAAS
jgi:Phosphomannomutase